MTEESNAEMSSAEAGFLEAVKDRGGIVEAYGDMKRNKSGNKKGWRGSTILIPDSQARAYKVPAVIGRIGEGIGRIGEGNDDMFMTVVARNEKGREKRFKIQIEFNELTNPARVVDIKEVTNRETEDLVLSDKNKADVLKMTTRGFERVLQKRS